MLSGLSFYLVPKLLASDLILTVDAAAGKAGIWPGGSLQNSEFISGDTFLLPTCLRGRDKRAPGLCLCASRFISSPTRTRGAAGLLGTEPRQGCPASALPEFVPPGFRSGDREKFLILFWWRPRFLACSSAQSNPGRRCPWLSLTLSLRGCVVFPTVPLGLPGYTSGVWALSTSRARAGLQGERSLAGACPPRAAFSSKPSRPPAFLIPPKRARSGEGTLRGQALWESRGPRVAPQVTQAAEARGWRAGRWQKGGKTSLPYS